MKTTLATTLCSLALALAALGQATPTVPPPTAAPVPAVATPPSTTVGTPAVVAVPTPVVAATAAGANDLQSKIERKVKKGLHITFGDDEDADVDVNADTVHPGGHHDRVRVHSSDNDDSALMAIPIVGIIFSTLFGAPVMIVGVIMFFSYWKQRQLHRTVRMMVEKGQPVPEGLFAVAPASPMKQRSDMRRGVVLMMVGLALMIFFAAMNDWEGGAWAVGIIPFLIGCGYLLVWKLEVGKVNTWKAGTDNPPPLP